MSDKYNYIFKAEKVAVIILEKTSELISNDKNMNKFSKQMMVGTINKFKPQITKYILNMDDNEARELINKIKDVIIEGDSNE